MERRRTTEVSTTLYRVTLATGMSLRVARLSSRRVSTTDPSRLSEEGPGLHIRTGPSASSGRDGVPELRREGLSNWSKTGSE